MKFAWLIKKKTRNYICECPFTKSTYYFIDWNFSQHLNRFVDHTFTHQSAYVAWLNCDTIIIIWLPTLKPNLKNNWAQFCIKLHDICLPTRVLTWVNYYYKILIYTQHQIIKSIQRVIYSISIHHLVVKSLKIIYLFDKSGSIDSLLPLVRN